MPKRVYPCLRFLFMVKTVLLNRKEVKNGLTSCVRSGRIGFREKISSLCLLHFKEEDFMRPFNAAGVQLKSELKKDDIWVCVFPTVHTKHEGEDDEQPSKTSREQEMVS